MRRLRSLHGQVLLWDLQVSCPWGALCQRTVMTARFALLSLFDDEDKGQWHCGTQPDGSPGCGICRVGGCEKFFHCVLCGTCLALASRKSHSCSESLLGSNCPICFELLQARMTSHPHIPLVSFYLLILFTCFRLAVLARCSCHATTQSTW